jgi:hypothetical protein
MNVLTSSEAVRYWLALSWCQWWFGVGRSHMMDLASAASFHCCFCRSAAASNAICLIFHECCNELYWLSLSNLIHRGRHCHWPPVPAAIINFTSTTQNTNSHPSPPNIDRFTHPHTPTPPLPKNINKKCPSISYTPPPKPRPEPTSSNASSNPPIVSSWTLNVRAVFKLPQSFRTHRPWSSAEVVMSCCVSLRGVGLDLRRGAVIGRRLINLLDKSE